MPVKVVDASALAALLFKEPEALAVATRIEGARLAAPALLDFELANVCLVKRRRSPEQSKQLETALRRRRRLAVSVTTVDHSEIYQLAVATGLTAYDASYLWLARRLGAELVTLDKQLAKAAAVRLAR